MIDFKLDAEGRIEQGTAGPMLADGSELTPARLASAPHHVATAVAAALIRDRLEHPEKPADDPEHAALVAAWRAKSWKDMTTDERVAHTREHGVDASRQLMDAPPAA